MQNFKFTVQFEGQQPTEISVLASSENEAIRQICQTGREINWIKPIPA